MADRTERQHAPVTTMIEIAARMAMETKGIARRDIDELGEVELTEHEHATLSDAQLHIEKARRTSSDLEELSDRGDHGSLAATAPWLLSVLAG